MPDEIILVPLQQKSINIYHDWNHCKAQFRVCPQDRYLLRADTLDCYPTCFDDGRQSLGGDS